MNRNLTTVALTIVALGLIAAFDIIPGAGFYAGVMMLTVGGGLLIALLVLRNWPFLFDVRATPATAARPIAPAAP
jgi:hypothetical protein